MNSRIGWLLVFLLITGFINSAFGQQDVDFHLNAHLLTGKKILKVKRDFNDSYLWVLAANNEVYRVNSLTLAVDDYTAKFSAYNGEAIIDIAGHNQDSLYVATRTKVIDCYKGVANLWDFDAAISYPINSIGISNFAYGGAFFGLFIGTDSLGYNYDGYRKQFLTFINSTYTKVYEATYRRLMFANYELAGYYDTTKAVPVDIFDADGGYTTAVWKGGQFGTSPNTAFYTTTSITEDAFNTNLYWGTDNGFFEIWNWPLQAVGGYYQHYLDNIKINKITDIFGLASIGITKQNLLIGSDNGLYFSQSVFYGRAATANELNNLSLVHYDVLGNVKINDICVNGTANSITSVADGCENGVWLGSDDGLYLLNPDYAKYVDPKQQLKAIYVSSPQTYSDTVSRAPVCSGGAIKLSLNYNLVNNTNAVQWVKNGTDIPGQTGNELAVTDSGEYHAVIYAPCENIYIETNHLKVIVVSGPVFSFNYPDKIQQCGNIPTPLQTDNNPLYHYRWYTNGALNGDTTASYQVTQTGKYKVEVSACTNSWVPSKEVEVDLITLPIPQITTDKPVYCAGDVASLSVNVPADNSYTINWYRDNVLLPADNNLTTIQDTTAGSYTVGLNSAIATCSQTSAGYSLSFTPSPYYVQDLPFEYHTCESNVSIQMESPLTTNYHYRWYTNGVLNGDTTDTFIATQTGKYKFEMSDCPGSWVATHELLLTLITLPTPVISTDKPVYCVGDNATLSVSAPADPSYTINWYRDGAPLIAAINQTKFITNIAGSYTVQVVNNQLNSDGTTCQQTSAAQVLTFNPPATVTIEQIVKTTICDGQVINLLAHYTGGTLKWSTGETTDQINVTTAGKYTATVTTAAGCTEDTSISVSFLPNPVFSVKDTSVCPYKGQPITLSAPDGFAKYAWNGVPGTQTYQVTQPQTVQLTVTDINGCQTTFPIKVADHCPDIWIPNTFTPNGDGINDTWVIEGLDGDPTVSVSVYTRYGGLVFQSKGYGTPWNGQYQGKKLPAGGYYYLVKAKNGGQKFSGPLTIIY